jgi:YrbI family 3-deoxy-D-manno-octulosonate 8-phosphate phosphatase
LARPHPVQSKQDFDGVMTDNFVYTFTDGSEAVKSSKYDSLALSMLAKAYPFFPIVIITSEKSAVVDARASKLGLKVERETTERSKVTIATELIERNGLLKHEVAFIGNDVNDLPLIEFLDLTYCPGDSPNRIKSAVRKILTKNGGDGAIREWVELIFPEIL